MTLFNGLVIASCIAAWLGIATLTYVAAATLPLVLFAILWMVLIISAGVALGFLVHKMSAHS